MIWEPILDGRFTSKNDGTEVFYLSDVQDYGLQVWAGGKAY